MTIRLAIAAIIILAILPATRPDVLRTLAGVSRAIVAVLLLIWASGFTSTRRPW